MYKIWSYIGAQRNKKLSKDIIMTHESDEVEKAERQ